ncbi:sphingomyelin synthase-related protein 1-like [Saccoglossus kowalevskii]
MGVGEYQQGTVNVAGGVEFQQGKIHPPLPDVVFKTLPFIAEGNAVANMAVVSSVIIFIAMLAIQTKLRYVALRRFLYTVPTMYLMRVVTLCVTSLPVPVSEIQCMPKTDGTMRTWVDRSFEQFITMSISTKEGVVCGDLMFSGHTGILIYFSYFITKYTPPSCRFLHVISWCTTVIGAVSLILSRGHYTIDVVISVYLAFFTLVFHDVMIEQRLISNYRFACMAFPLMQYIECW